MKSRLTLTISPAISHQAKRKARASGRSLSSLIEELLAKAMENDEAGEAPSPPLLPALGGETQAEDRAKPPPGTSPEQVRRPSMNLDFALNLNLADFEDAMQVAAAEKFGAQTIATRNLKDYVHSPIKAMAPRDLLALL